MRCDGDIIEIPTILACRLGIREAVCLQKLHNLLGGQQWIQKSYKDWHMHLPFMSVGAIKAHFIDLQRRGLVLYRRQWRDKYYSINYDALEKLYK